jgi:hypothetical protein
LRLKRATGRIDAAKAPLEARRNELAARRIGNGILVDELGEPSQVPVLVAEEVGLTEICPEIAPVLRHIGVDP